MFWDKGNPASWAKESVVDSPVDTALAALESIVEAYREEGGEAAMAFVEDPTLIKYVGDVLVSLHDLRAESHDVAADLHAGDASAAMLRLDAALAHVPVRNPDDYARAQASLNRETSSMVTSPAWQCPVCDSPGHAHHDVCFVKALADEAHRLRLANKRLSAINGRLRAALASVPARSPDAPPEGCEWVEVEGETLPLTHAEADDWLERPTFGQGLPASRGWKDAMGLDPTEYSPEFQDEYRRLWLASQERVRELESRSPDALTEALEEIAAHPVISERGDENCDWHCTAEIVDLAKRTLARSAGNGDERA